MKDLPIEEKAYDGNYEVYTELINRLEDVKNAIKNQNYGIAMDILYKPYPQFQITSFPELKENKGEKINKALIHLVNSNKELHFGIDNYDGVKWCDILAWLEKQGVQHPKFRIGDTIKCKYDDRQFTIKSVDLDKGTYTYTQEGYGNNIDYADEKFELVEQKPADKVEPKFKVGQTIKKEGFNLGFTIVKIEDSFYYNDMGDNFPFTDQDNLELVDESPAWSEEDEDILNTIINYFKVDIECTDEDDIVRWLNFLKDRIQPQSKQEWSKEDEKILSDIIKDLVHPWNEYIPDRIEDEIKWLKNRLKSLRPQTTWKPNLAQLNALSIVSKGNAPDDIESIISLYNDLKKLMEE